MISSSFPSGLARQAHANRAIVSEVNAMGQPSLAVDSAIAPAFHDKTRK